MHLVIPQDNDILEFVLWFVIHKWGVDPSGMWCSHSILYLHLSLDQCSENIGSHLNVTRLKTLVECQCVNSPSSSALFRIYNYINNDNLKQSELFQDQSLLCQCLCTLHDSRSHDSAILRLVLWRMHDVTTRSISPVAWLTHGSTHEYLTCWIFTRHSRGSAICSCKLSVKRNLSLLQSDIHWNPLHQNDSYLDTN